MVKFQGLLCWWCCGPFGLWRPRNDPQRSSTEELKDTSTVSEPVQRTSEECDHMDQLRSEVKQMMCNRGPNVPPPAEVEDVVVGVDYLPVYQEHSGKLTFIGVKLKIAFTEERRKGEKLGGKST